MWSPNLLFEVLDQGRHSRGGIAAIEGRGDHRVLLLRTVLPGHDFIRVGLAPPIRAGRPRIAAGAGPADLR